MDKITEALKQELGEGYVNAGRIDKDWRGWFFQPFQGQRFSLGATVAEAIETIENMGEW